MSSLFVSPRKPPKTAIVVAQRIVADINRMGNVPGERLPPEHSMLEQYSVSRGTLREALRFLELQGVITLKPGPGGGPIVQKPDSQSLEIALTLMLQFEQAPYRSIAESREGIEPIIARLAAKRITPELKEQLIESVEVMREKLHDLQTFLEMNKVFHHVIAVASENVLLANIIDALLDLLDGSSIGVDYSTVRREAILEAHERVLEAILSGNEDAAEKAMLDHIDEYLVYLEKRHPEALEWPVVWRSV